MIVAVAVGAAVSDAGGQQPPTPNDRDGDGIRNAGDCAPDDPTRGSFYDIPSNGIDENCTGTDAFPFVAPQITTSFTWQGNQTRVHRVAIGNVPRGLGANVYCVGSGCPTKRRIFRRSETLRPIVIRKPFGDRPLRAPHARLRVSVAHFWGVAWAYPTPHGTGRRDGVQQCEGALPLRKDGCTKRSDSIDSPIRLRTTGCGIVRVVGQFRPPRNGIFTVRWLYVVDLPPGAVSGVICNGRGCVKHFGSGPRRRDNVSTADLTKKWKGTRLRHGSSLSVSVFAGRGPGRVPTSRGVQLVTRWTVSKSGELHRTDGCRNVVPHRIVPCPD